MHRLSLLLLLSAGCLCVPGTTSASADQPACVYTDKAPFANTGYTSGPGVPWHGGGTDGGLAAAGETVAGDPDTDWSQGTDRINGTHRILDGGTWTVTWEWGTAYSHNGADNAASVIMRAGVQLEGY